MTVRPSSRLQIQPAGDVEFGRFVTEVIEVMRAQVAARAEAGLEPLELQWRLRERYPAAVVLARDEPADPRAGDVPWDVYRFADVAPDGRWWQEPDHAWAILDDARRFVEVSTSLSRIIEAPREVLLGRPVDAFSNPEDVSALDDILGLWTELQVRGELHATLRLRRLDGTRREIEYHVTKDGAGPGRHLATVRERDGG